MYSTIRPRRQITVVLPTSMGCYRDLLHGIGAFANARGSWHVQYLTPLNNIPEFLKDRPPEGMLLGEVWEVVPWLEQTKELNSLVMVCAKGGHDPTWCSKLATIDVAESEMGKLAAEYFLKRQYKNFAYIGYEGDLRDGARGFGYVEHLKSQGIAVSTFAPRWDPITIGRGWTQHYLRNEVGQFLKSLPKPVALMAYNDVRGREIVKACRLIGIAVPEEVAILGVDNDTLECDLSSPPLSSISIPWHRIGYEAAAQLDHLLEDEPSESHMWIPPDGIAERQSTNSVAVSDPNVAAALLFIRENAHVPFGVDDVVNRATTGRRTLEKRFREQLGRSLLDEISRVRLERAKLLLSQTELSIADVAARCGYSKATWFSTCFQQAFRMSPGKFRDRTSR